METIESFIIHELGEGEDWTATSYVDLHRKSDTITSSSKNRLFYTANFYKTFYRFEIRFRNIVVFEDSREADVPLKSVVNHLISIDDIKDIFKAEAERICKLGVKLFPNNCNWDWSTADIKYQTDEWERQYEVNCGNR